MVIYGTLIVIYDIVMVLGSCGAKVITVVSQDDITPVTMILAMKQWSVKM